jgi:PPK2 family polyphosphate:nucleotide phosphotransferase
MERYRVTDHKAFELAQWDPADIGDFEGGKAKGRAKLKKLTPRLADLQETFYADGRHKLLVVLQGTDTSGKGGAIRKAFEGLGPAGVRVTSFKAPTELELAHDFLWRVHPQVPSDGQIAIFDRSHYEDVLIVRVHDLVPEARWRARYAHIRAFEQMLADEGTVILKFFLHISKEEQAERLRARLADPTKNWKFRAADLDERGHWDEYQDAYEEMVRRTAAEHAPWFVVPANRKWFRDLVICHTLIDTLERLDLRYPEPSEDLSGVTIE